MNNQLCELKWYNNLFIARITAPPSLGKQSHELFPMADELQGILLPEGYKVP